MKKLIAFLCIVASVCLADGMIVNPLVEQDPLSVKTVGDTMTGELINNVGFRGNGSGLTNVQATVVPVYDTNTLIVSDITGDEEFLLGSYLYSASESAWYLGGFDIEQDQAMIYVDQATNHCNLLYLGYIYYTNDNPDPWSGTWSVDTTGIATNTLVVSGLSGDETEGNGTYLWGDSSWTNENNWSIGWTDYSWGLFTNSDPALTLMFTNDVGDMDVGPWEGSWVADQGAGDAPSVALSLTSTPTVVRDYGPGQAVQSPWIQNIDAAGYSVTNISTIEIDGTANISGDIIIDGAAGYDGNISIIGQGGTNYLIQINEGIITNFVETAPE